MGGEIPLGERLKKLFECVYKYRFVSSSFITFVGYWCEGFALCSMAA